jgi:AcrR family transcriptional regulator
MTTFQRARSDEQRAVRSQAILDTAAAMLAQMPVAELSLNELSRRVGLAKSNVLRYFESREAVLLELVHTATVDWLVDLGTEMRQPTAAGSAPAERSAWVASAFAVSLSRHPLLCELISAQTAVLERNVSAQAALRFKRTSRDDLVDLANLLLSMLPELGEDAPLFAARAVMLAGALWIHAHPASAMLAAYELEPALADMRVDFVATLEDMLTTLLAGLFTRRAV